MDDLILDVITEAHRDTKKMRSICPICKTRQVSTGSDLDASRGG